MKMNSRHQHRMPVRRGGRRAVLTVTAGLAVFSGAAAPAHAGTMRYWSCQTAGGVATSATGWTGVIGSWNYSNASEGCSGGGPMQLDATPQLNVPTNQGGAVWTYQAPANTTISTARVVWGGWLNGADYSASVGMTVNRDSSAYDGAHVLDNCQFFAGCSSVAAAARTYSVNADRLLIGLGCGGSDGAVCGAGDRGHLRIYSAGIDLVDDSAPSPAAAASGSALRAGTLAGGESLIVPVTDTGVGVADIEVKLDGAVVVPRANIDNNGGKCVPIEGGYKWPVPCRLAATATVTVPTAAVADGAHMLTATVWDAAGNPAVLVNQKVTTDNVPPPAIKSSTSSGTNSNLPRIDGVPAVGAQLTGFDGAWTDVSAQITREWQSSDSVNGPWAAITGAVATTYRPSALMSGKYLRLAVTATSKEGTGTATSTPVFVDPQSGGNLDLLSANNGAGGDPSSGRLVPAKKRTRATVGFKHAVRVAGKLLDAAGKPIGGGSIDVYETVAGGARAKVATITSDARGRYSWSPSTRSNRLVELQYSRQKGSDQYQSGQSLQVLVRAGVSAKLARRHIPAQGRGVLRGRVLVDGFPTDGVWVEIRTTVRGHDQVIGTARTDAAGRFRWSHKFAAKFGYVPLRVRVRGDRNMPALPSTSRTVRLLIG